LKTPSGSALGTVVIVRRAPISFKHEAEHYEFAASGLAAASVDAMPNHECCKQPELVWYTPLVSIADRKVGFTRTASYEGKIADGWQRSEENSAFYGTFTLSN